MILTHKSSLPSARTLRDTILRLGGKKLLVTTDPSKPKFVHVRYGSTSRIECKESGYNSRGFVSLSSDKEAFSEFLLNRDIYTPKFSFRTKNLKFPLLIRSSLNWSGGRGIRVITNKEQFDRYWQSTDKYRWTPFISVEFEIRLHVIVPSNKSYEVVRIFKKVLNNEDQVEDEFPIRNNSTHHFALRNMEKYGKAIYIAHKIAESAKPLGGRFFSLDMGWDKDNKEYIVFEANSGSGLNDNTSEVYAQFLLDEGVV